MYIYDHIKQPHRDMYALGDLHYHSWQKYKFICVYDHM